MERRLLGSERDGLLVAILSGYSSFNSLERLVQKRFDPVPGTDDVRIANLAMFSGRYDELPAVIGRLIDHFAEFDLVDELVSAAAEERRSNVRLKKFAERYFASIQRQVQTKQLERYVIPGSRFHDPVEWREQLEIAEWRICRIRTPASSGTGFLVARDVVLTNHHVIADVIGSPDAVREVTIQFDYKVGQDGRLQRATAASLAEQWCLKCSPPSAADVGKEGAPLLPEPNELDYAFLKLSSAVGDQNVEDRCRGWFDLAAVPAPAVDSAIFILQYPGDQPLKLAFETRSVLRVNANGTRVQYATRTDDGSSGAPCFDRDWKVIALHHSGDPDYRRDAKYNEGIPMGAIVASLPASLQTTLGVAAT